MIEVMREGAMWRLRINRPEKANSLTAQMLGDLIKAAEAARSAANVLVITGSGSVFSAGADLDEARTGLAINPLWEELSASIASLPCLTIAAMNGTLAGGAFGMALACDLRVAAEAAEFFYPVMKLGLLPQPSDPVRMHQLIGPARTKMILMAGQRIGAGEALRWGLIDRVAAAHDLDATVQDLAQVALRARPDHVAAIKSLIR